jgi:hypothetical protein
MAPEVSGKNQRNWSWMHFAIALGLILFGLLSWFGGLGIGLGVGDSGSSSASWVLPVAEAFFMAGPFIVVAGMVWLLVLGVVWLLVLLVRRRGGGS